MMLSLRRMLVAPAPASPPCTVVRRLGATAAVAAAVLTFGAQAQPSTSAAATALSAERCLQPDSLAMAARCELRHRYCVKPPNEAWRTRWRAVCGGVPGAALIGTATVEGGQGRRKFEAAAQVIWLPKAGSRTQYVPYGTLTFTGKSRECAASETVDIGPEDGELEIKPGSGGPAQYRGAGFKAMDIRVLCTRAAGVIAAGTGSETKSDAKSDARRAAAMAAAGVTVAGPPVPWFNTAEAFRAPQGGLLQGEMKDPDGIWTWRWNFKP